MESLHNANNYIVNLYKLYLSMIPTYNTSRDEETMIILYKNLLMDQITDTV